MITVALVGRTNVGKSTLFNALVGRRLAIVEDEPGVTRDRTYGTVTKGSIPFSLIDTGGIVDETQGVLDDQVRAQVELALEEADIVIALFDALHGPHPFDNEIVDLLRRSNKPVLWAVNKCEKEDVALAAQEFYQLGVDEVLPISAAHRLGVRDLVKRIEQIIRRSDLSKRAREREPEIVGETITIALVGRPNVGKSSIVNRLVGEERVIVDDVAGTTRDSIEVPLVRDKQRYTVIDTAGLRKKARVESGTVERFSTLRTLRSLARADVALLVLDGSGDLITQQESKIASLVHERGKGLVIVVNKWDVVEKDHTSVKRVTDGIYKLLPFAQYAPIVFVSAKTGRRCPSLIELATQITREKKVRLSTSEVNKVFSRVFHNKPPPQYRGEPVKLLFGTQVEVSPPTFVLILNTMTRIRPSYERYLERALREVHPFTGTAVKIIFRKRTTQEERASRQEHEATR